MPIKRKNYAGIINHPRGKELGWRSARGYIIPFSSALGVGQYFSNMCIARINQQKPCNIVFTGEAGISKTYSAISFARYLDPKFSIRHVCMTYEEFMRAMTDFKQGEIILLDEPEYVAGHREWYKSQNQALVATMRSGRFKVHPVFLPVINKRLLDKVVRENLIQFMVVLRDRGIGEVYRISPSQFTNITYNVPICSFRGEMLDIADCRKTWCYDCKLMEDCELLRGQYERKRRDIQERRYKEDLERSKIEARKRISYEEWYEEALKVLSECYYINKSGDRKISAEKIKKSIGCSMSTANRIRRELNQLSPEELKTKLEE